MSVVVDVQMALDDDTSVTFPNYDQIQAWASATISSADEKQQQGQWHDDVQMTVRIVEETEICQLNADYRHKNGPTNVLSFPFEAPPGVPADEYESTIGDLVVCASVVEKEAREQGKAVLAHWAHMIVHGTLHLLGYDHQNEQEAFEMESLEVRVLSDLGFSNPYM